MELYHFTIEHNSPRWVFNEGGEPDYQNRQLLNAIQGSIRTATERFIGEPMTEATRRVLRTTIDQIFHQQVMNGLIRQYNTPSISYHPDGNMTLSFTAQPMYGVHHISTDLTIGPFHE